LVKKYEFWSYELAQKYIKKFKCKNKQDFLNRVKKGEFDPRIPKDPAKYYTKQKKWKDYQNFLGYDPKLNTRLRYLKNYPTYDELKKMVKPAQLSNIQEYEKWVKENNLLYKVPLRPDRTYSKLGWEDDWGIFFGLSRMTSKKRKFRNYDSTKKYAQDNNVKSQDDWNKLKNSPDFPNDIPKDIEDYYKKTGEWIDWHDITGSFVSTAKRNYLDYEDVEKYARQNNVKSQDDWNKLTKSPDFPNNIPKTPNHYYDGKGWDTWGKFTGTGIIAPQKRDYRSIEELKKFLKENKIISKTSWENFCKNNKLPSDIPVDIEGVYKNKGTWITWGDILGHHKVAPHLRNSYPYYEAKLIYQKFAKEINLEENPNLLDAWKKFYDKNIKDPRLPKDPTSSYAIRKVKARLRGKRSLKNLQPGIDYYYDIYDNFGVEDPKWSTNKIIGLLQSLLEDDYILKTNPEILADLIEEKGLDKISSKFAKLIKLIPTQHGNKEFSEYIKKIVEERNTDQLYQTSKFESEKILVNDDEEILISEETQIHENTGSEEIISEPEFNDPADVLAQAQKTYDLRSKRKFMTENEVSISDDKESLEFYIRHFINKLWHDTFHDESKVQKLRKIKTIGKFSDKIRNMFLEEYDQAKKLSIPHDYNFRIDNKLAPPTLMQRYFSLMTKFKPFYANFSGTGAGKTISAILASRINKSKMNLIICPNGVVTQWKKVIEKVFPNSKIITKREAFSVVRDTNQFQYLIINYDQFNQTYTENNIIKLGSQKIDFVILDEIHFSKTTHLENLSKRRIFIDQLLSLIREINTKVKVIGLSATPVVNNLVEGRSLIEMLSGQEWDEEIKTKLTLRNARKLHKKFTIMSLREEPEYHKPIIKESTVIAQIPSTFEIRNLNHDKLALEQICTEARIPEILKRIKGKTVIYTEFVGGNIPGKPSVVKMLQNALKKEKISNVVHTGDDHTGLDEFVKNKKIKVLIASKPISTGVDDLQKVCHNLIFNNLPWTHALYTQIIGRLIRRGQEKPVTIHHILSDVEYDGKVFAYDKRRMDAIINKKTILDCAVSGVYPENNLIERDAALKALRDWIKRLQEGKRLDLMRPYRIYDLEPQEIKRRERKYGDFNTFNRKLIMSTSENNHKTIQKDPKSWYAYHSALNENKKTWSFDPNEIWIEKISKMKKSFKIGDFGCGEAMIARKFGKDRVHSFDLHAIDKDLVQECNIKSLPLKDESIDIAVFNLSLMGTDWEDFLVEAKRVLEFGGRLFICDTESHLNGYLKSLREVLESLEFSIYRDETKAKFVMIEAIKD